MLKALVSYLDSGKIEILKAWGMFICHPLQNLEHFTPKTVAP